MTQHLTALTVTVFAAWAGGCLLLLALMLVPKLRSTVSGLWPLMASELLIISVGLLPWHLPAWGIAAVLVLAGARVGYEAGSVYGLKDGMTYAAATGLLLGLLVLAVWNVPQFPWWGWLVTLAALGLAGSMMMPARFHGLGRFLLYPALPFAAFVLCARNGFTGIIVLSFLFVELFDSFSLLGGKLFGRHLLAPRISPRKTWEGFGLGLSMLMACSLVIAWLLGEPLATFAIVAALVSISALVGDLVASAIKRRSGVKDYPTIIPVQGGLLDIIDAWIVAAPVAVAGFVLLGNAV